MHVKGDDQRPHEDVKVGDIWFVWGYHWLIKQERISRNNGVREVLMVNQNVKRNRTWVAAWRVQRHGAPSQKAA